MTFFRRRLYFGVPFTFTRLKATVIKYSMSFSRMEHEAGYLLMTDCPISYVWKVLQVEESSLKGTSFAKLGFRV